MGNGPEASGDGAKYCGRGYIQLTGKDNYTAFGKSIIEIPIDHGSKKMGLLHAHLNDSGSDTKPRVFLVTNHQGLTTKLAVWMDEIE